MNVTGRQWQIDTADVPTLFLPTPTVTTSTATGKIELDGVVESLKNAGGTNIKIEQIEFFGYLAAGDKVIIKDTSGRTVWQSVGEADFKTMRSGGIGWVRGGLQVTQLDSGSVLIYMDSK